MTFVHPLIVLSLAKRASAALALHYWGLQEVLRQREQQQQRGTVRLRRRGGGSSSGGGDARASLVKAFSSFVRAFWQQKQQLPYCQAA